MTEKTERKDEESSRSRNINKIDFKNIDDDADDFGAAKFKTEVLSSRKINFNSDEEDADEEDNSGMDVDDSLSEEVPPSPEPFKTPVSRTLSRTQAKASPLVSPSSPSQSPLRSEMGTEFFDNLLGREALKINLSFKGIAHK